MRRLATTLFVAIAAFSAGFGVRGCVDGDERPSDMNSPAPVRTAQAEALRTVRSLPRSHASPVRDAAAAPPAATDESSSEPATVVDDELRTGPAVWQGVTIRGRCIDPRGAPVAGVQVVPSTPFQVCAVTDQNGRFDLLLAASGERYIRIIPDSRFATRRVALPAPTDRTIDVGDVVLSAGGTIRGVFLDMDERPVAGAPLLLHDLDQTCSARGGVTTDKDGRFVFEHVPEGRVCISGRSPGALIAAPEQDAQLWPVHAGDEIVLRIRSDHFVRFSYVDESGATVRIAGPRVRWFPLDDPAGGETWEWEGGWWSGCLVPVSPGAQYEIQFEIDGWLPLTHRFEGGEAIEKRETLVFRRAPR